MKFFVDENLSPRVAELLTRAGYHAVHVRDIDAISAADPTLMTIAAENDQVIISADTDFGALLAQARATKPSVLLVRELMELRPPELVSVILAQLEILDKHLQNGAIVALTATGIRVRPLPLR